MSRQALRVASPARHPWCVALCLHYEELGLLSCLLVAEGRFSWNRDFRAADLCVVVMEGGLRVRLGHYDVTT